MKPKSKPKIKRPNPSVGPKPTDISAKFQPIKKTEPLVKALFYGRSGSGKTTLSATFPKPFLLIDVKEEGTDSISDVGEDNMMLEVKEWQDFELAYYYLNRGDHGFKSVIIDSLSMLQVLLLAHVKGEKEAMTQQMWGEVSSKMQEAVIAMRDLPLHVAFIAQDRTRAADEGQTDQLEPEVGPALMPSVAKLVNGAVKIIGNTYLKEVVKSKKGQVVRRIEYRLRLGAHPYYITKVRSPKSSKVPSYIVDPTFEKLLAIMKGEVEQ